MLSCYFDDVPVRLTLRLNAGNNSRATMKSLYAHENQVPKAVYHPALAGLLASSKPFILQRAGAGHDFYLSGQAD